MILAWNNLLLPVGVLLAADDDGMVEILVFVVFIVLGLIGHIIKKAQEKQKVDEAERKVEQAKRRRAARQDASGRRQAEPPAVSGGADSRTGTRPAPQRGRSAAAQRAAVVGQALSAARAKPPPPPRTQTAGARLQPLGAHADLAQGVQEEVRKVRRHLSTEEAERRRRLAHVKELKSGIGPEPELVPATAAEGGPKIRLNLGNPKAARTAIICAEVLGRPKALRTNPEPWEM